MAAGLGLIRSGHHYLRTLTYYISNCMIMITAGMSEMKARRGVLGWVWRRWRGRFSESAERAQRHAMAPARPVRIESNCNRGMV